MRRHPSLLFFGEARWPILRFTYLTATAHTCQFHHMALQVRIHLDDQMDAKSLLGAYVCTAVPGEFAWQPGPLTQVGQQWCLAPAEHACS